MAHEVSKLKYCSEVLDESAAADAGLQVGDVVVSVDDQTIRDSSELRASVLVKRPGTTSTLSVLRDGQSVEITVVSFAWFLSEFSAFVLKSVLVANRIMGIRRRCFFN